MFESEFLTMMPHTVTIYPRTGYTSNGIPSYAGSFGKAYQARIVGKNLSLRRTQTQEQTVVFDIYLNSGGDAIGLEDKVELPVDGAWLDRFPKLFAVSRSTDEDGHHHTKLQCGWQYHRQGQ
jgi:hypothetical protein